MSRRIVIIIFMLTILSIKFVSATPISLDLSNTTKEHLRIFDLNTLEEVQLLEFDDMTGEMVYKNEIEIDEASTYLFGIGEGEMFYVLFISPGSELVNSGIIDMNYLYEKTYEYYSTQNLIYGTENFTDNRILLHNNVYVLNNNIYVYDTQALTLGSGYNSHVFVFKTDEITTYIVKYDEIAQYVSSSKQQSISLDSNYNKIASAYISRNYNSVLIVTKRFYLFNMTDLTVADLDKHYIYDSYEINNYFTPISLVNSDEILTVYNMYYNTIEISQPIYTDIVVYENNDYVSVNFIINSQTHTIKLKAIDLFYYADVYNNKRIDKFVFNINESAEKWGVLIESNKEQSITAIKNRYYVGNVTLDSVKLTLTNNLIALLLDNDGTVKQEITNLEDFVVTPGMKMIILRKEGDERYIGYYADYDMLKILADTQGIVYFYSDTFYYLAVMNVLDIHAYKIALHDDTYVSVDYIALISNRSVNKDNYYIKDDGYKEGTFDYHYVCVCDAFNCNYYVFDNYNHKRYEDTIFDYLYEIAHIKAFKLVSGYDEVYDVYQSVSRARTYVYNTTSKVLYEVNWVTNSLKEVTTVNTTKLSFKIVEQHDSVQNQTNSTSNTTNTNDIGVEYIKIKIVDHVLGQEVLFVKFVDEYNNIIYYYRAFNNEVNIPTSVYYNKDLRAFACTNRACYDITSQIRRNETTIELMYDPETRSVWDVVVVLKNVENKYTVSFDFVNKQEDIYFINSNYDVANKIETVKFKLITNNITEFIYNSKITILANIFMKKTIYVYETTYSISQNELRIEIDATKNTQLSELENKVNKIENVKKNFTENLFDLITDLTVIGNIIVAGISFVVYRKTQSLYFTILIMLILSAVITKLFALDMSFIVTYIVITVIALAIKLFPTSISSIEEIVPRSLKDKLER